jgi:hypothetical protein
MPVFHRKLLTQKRSTLLDRVIATISPLNAVNNEEGRRLAPFFGASLRISTLSNTDREDVFDGSPTESPVRR